MRVIYLGIIIISLLAGCLGGTDDTATATIQDVVSSPDSYANQEVVIRGATVEDIVPLQQGMTLISLVDPSGARLAGVYTGDLYVVNRGDMATFTGEITTQEALGGGHLGSNVVMKISSISEVSVGGGTVPAGTSAPPVSQNPTVQQILNNANTLEGQVVTIEGTVEEVRAVSGQHAETDISYVKVNDGSASMWAAVPQAQVDVGSAVTIRGSVDLSLAPMIGETVIILSDSIQGGTSSESPHGTSTTSEGPVEVTPVEKAEGGYTVEELFSQRQELNGQTVSVRGTVVKTSAEIMGAFWLHIQDGTGDAGAGTNDITVTYTGDPPVSTGDVVLVTGTLSADKDLGAGYFYQAIIENATVEK